MFPVAPMAVNTIKGITLLKVRAKSSKNMPDLQNPQLGQHSGHSSGASRQTEDAEHNEDRVEHPGPSIIFEECKLKKREKEWEK